MTLIAVNKDTAIKACGNYIIDCNKNYEAALHSGIDIYLKNNMYTKPGLIARLFGEKPVKRSYHDIFDGFDDDHWRYYLFIHGILRRLPDTSLYKALSITKRKYVFLSKEDAEFVKKWMENE